MNRRLAVFESQDTVAMSTDKEKDKDKAKTHKLSLKGACICRWSLLRLDFRSMPRLSLFPVDLRLCLQYHRVFEACCRVCEFFVAGSLQVCQLAVD